MDFEYLVLIVMILMNVLEEKTITVTTGLIASIILVVTNVIVPTVGKAMDLIANNLIFVHLKTTASMAIAKIPIMEEFVIVTPDSKSKLDTGPWFNTVESTVRAHMSV